MPQNQQFLSNFFIKVGGSIPEGLMDDLAEVTVDLTLNMPEMFTLRLYDPEIKWIDNTSLFKFGQTVEISAKTAEGVGGQGSETPLIKGEITALEPNFSEDGLATLIVRGYANAHRLHRGKKTRTFLKMTDSNIVSKVASEAGLSAQVDSTNVTHDYVIQSNQTDMEFLRGLAARNHYNLYADGRTLYFKKAETSRGDTPVLKWKETLRSFRPSVAATHQVNEVLVRGWDIKTKKEIVGRATPAALAPEVGGNYVPSSASSAFGSANGQLVTQPVMSQGEADALAQSLANDIQNEFVQAEGHCFGEPKIKPGYTVKIENIGTRFSGKYTVTSAIHTYSPEQGYETIFQITGRQPETVIHLLGLDHGQPGDNGNGGSHPLLAVGLVTNNQDPEDMGRVKVKFPWLSDTDESDWARVVSLGAGPDRGSQWLPEVNDEVLVAFGYGNIRSPFVIGGLWNGQDKPPLSASDAVSGGGVVKRIFQSRTGHKILLQDTDGNELIHIIDKTGKNEILIDSAQNTITINADMDIKMEAKGNMTMKCNQTLKMECMNLDINATGSAKLQATGALTVKSTATTSIEGSMMNIQSTGPLTAKGTPISLN